MSERRSKLSKATPTAKKHVNYFGLSLYQPMSSKVLDTSKRDEKLWSAIHYLKNPGR